MLYRNYINDEWAYLLEDLYSWCRGAWQYLIPQSAKDQQRLQAMCEQALAFENHYLICYKSFLLTQLQDMAEAAPLTALRVVGQIPYNDVEIVDAIRALVLSKRPDIQKLAQETLTTLESI